MHVRGERMDGGQLGELMPVVDADACSVSARVERPTDQVGGGGCVRAPNDIIQVSSVGGHEFITGGQCDVESNVDNRSGT